ncbi:formylglycine-generating enzyme family protein [Candidatus Poribacteria bacterium]|nr:formylglycine-generating enzyme family protein [Candidatus Poribacteria bacterium]
MSKPEGKTYTNSIGMRFVRIEPGTFTMGIDQTPLPSEITDNVARRKSWKEDERPYLRNGDFDEYPPHKVTISRPFYMSVFELTNVQYEQFDPEHRKLRGKLGFSKADDEAVVFVSWHDAVAFCEWVSKKERIPYRLPTEAEWEYACRAGTTTYYHTGDSLPEAFHKNPNESWYPSVGRGGSEAEEVVPLTVGGTPPNPWGLHDMHGNVEEWCYDWYGPYEAEEQIDPIGREDGLFRVTRGGSHSTPIYYLRSSKTRSIRTGIKSSAAQARRKRAISFNRATLFPVAAVERQFISAATVDRPGATRVPENRSRNSRLVTQAVGLRASTRASLNSRTDGCSLSDEVTPSKAECR